MRVDCPAFVGGTFIPTKHANRGIKGGQNISLPASWQDIPLHAKSFVLTIIDRHPVARNWVHWGVIDIPSDVRRIPEDASGDKGRMPHGCTELRNSFGTIGYGGPQPPRGSGPHEYEICVYALDVATLSLQSTASLADLERALSGKVLESARAVGVFEQ